MFGCSPRARTAYGCTRYLHCQNSRLLSASRQSSLRKLKLSYPIGVDPIEMEYMWREEVKACHDRIQRSMTITIGGTLVLCDCRNRLHQVRQRQTWLQQPVHGGFDLQVSTRVCARHLSGPEAAYTIVRVANLSVDAAVHRTAKLRTGGMEASKAFKLQEHHKTHSGSSTTY